MRGRSSIESSALSSLVSGKELDYQLTCSVSKMTVNQPEDWADYQDS
jgi:hypothetical protein